MPMDDDDALSVSLDELVENNAEDEKQQIIEENLKQVKFAKSKIRRAQESYYGDGGTGRSPLTRVNNVTSDTTNKGPVHTRLGRGLRLRRTFPMNFTTDTILPRNRRILRITKKDINIRGNTGKYRLLRGSQAQLRLERIRLAHAESLQNPQLIQPVTKLRLQRRGINGAQFHTMPTNYTIQIPNNTFLNHSAPTQHSIQAELDMVIQDAITRIQMVHSHPPEMIQTLPPLPVNTGFTLNDRFSSLP